MVFDLLLAACLLAATRSRVSLLTSNGRCQLIVIDLGRRSRSGLIRADKLNNLLGCERRDSGGIDGESQVLFFDFVIVLHFDTHNVDTLNRVGPRNRSASVNDDTRRGVVDRVDYGPRGMLDFDFRGVRLADFSAGQRVRLDME